MIILDSGGQASSVVILPSYYVESVLGNILIFLLKFLFSFNLLCVTPFMVFGLISWKIQAHLLTLTCFDYTVI